MQSTLAPALFPVRPGVGRGVVPPAFPPNASRRRPARLPSGFPSPPVSREPADPFPTPPAWGLFRLAGSLVEISGTADSGVLSSALELVAEAQHDQILHLKRRREQEAGGRTRGHRLEVGPSLIAWVATTRSLFFPPDAVESGIALDQLILLRLETPAAQLRAAIRLVHSGAFGLVVVDLADAASPELPYESHAPGASTSPRRRRNAPGVPPLSQLAGLAHKYRTAIVLLTEKPPDSPSLDPRVGKRFDASRQPNGVVITVLKDKDQGCFSSPGVPADRTRERLVPGFRFEKECHEPAGMC